MPRQLEIFPWNENFVSGIDEIDHQHKRLIELLNVLVSHLAFQSDIPALNNIFDELKKYTVEHFSTEEKIWHDYFQNDPWEEWHKHAHQDFIGRVLEIKAKETAENVDQVIAEIVSFLTHWLAFHIIESDKRMAKVALALSSGISLEQAKDLANKEMSGATRVLIDTVMGMYDKLANRTIEMTREINRRIKAEEELKAAQAELIRLKDEAVAANRSKSAFLATMSHEIRTPMNGILGMAQLLLMPELAENDRQDYARTVLNSGETLLALLNDILDLSKIEAGKFELEFATFNPERLLHETANLFEGVARAKGLRVETSWHGTPNARYRSAPIRLRQMLSNLVSNSVKFTHDGFIRMEGREIDSSDDHVQLEFSVIDSGIGIPQDKLARLFKPFSQVDGANTQVLGSTGLGLSIVRNLAQLMQGKVGVDSVEGQGSRFWFRIRVEPHKGKDEAQTLPLDQSTQTPAGKTPFRLLVVEDNATNQRVLGAFLKKLGIRFECVENGLEAIERITVGTPPDLVLMDCQMPLMDGFEATTQIRQWEAVHGKSRLPIIALTANAYETDRQQCLSVGMDDFITKPVDLAKLSAVISKWLTATAS